MYNEKFPTLHIVNHPLVQHKLTVMRDKNTSVKDFRSWWARSPCSSPTRPPVTCPPPQAHRDRHLCTWKCPCWPARSSPSFPSSVQVWAWWTACCG